MKVAIFLCICTIQIISGKEENFEQAITSASEEIKATQVLWKNNGPQVLKDISTLIEESNVEYSKDIERIRKEIKDPVQVKAHAEYKDAYEKLIAESKAGARKFTLIHPDLIAKIYNPLIIAKDAYDQISKEIKTIKNTCKETDFEELNILAIETVNEVTNCLVDGTENIPTIPQGIRYIKDLLLKYTRKNINHLKRCPHEVGANCLEQLKSFLLEASENIKKYSEDDSGTSSGWLQLHMNIIKSCVNRKVHQFTNRTFGIKEQC